MSHVAAIADPSEFQTAVLDWFAGHGRGLNFRRTRDPYAVLVAEMMAQQTQVSRVEPAWEAFLARFPTVDVLAAASVADVIRAWRGMGYNRRALNLQRAAQVVVRDHHGRIPGDLDALERLPGVGPYTARAVAAIAFGRRVAAVDTNVRRVVGRVVAGSAGPMAQRELQQVADSLVPEGRAGAWTHALMDIGAMFCRPGTPRCESCPLADVCAFARAAAEGVAPGGSRQAGPSRKPSGLRPFPLTTRWLRGRIVDRAREAEIGGWVRVDQRIGRHVASAVAAAAGSLASEGLLELHPSDRGLARLPQ